MDSFAFQIGYLLAIPGSDKTEEDFDIPGMEFKV